MARFYISLHVERRVRAAAQNRCGYCLSPQHLVMARLEIEHIIPLAQQGTNDEMNLWLACPLCNRYKGERINALDPITNQIVPLFNLFHCSILAFNRGSTIFSGAMMEFGL